MPANEYRSLALLCILAGAVLLTFNWGCLTITLIFRRVWRPLPFIAGALAGLGLYLLGHAATSRKWWVPVLIDYGFWFHAVALSQRVTRRS
ncbi:MAG: hypothetical protein U0Q16_07105 [Bryobacteraceae bacterium]